MTPMEEVGIAPVFDGRSHLASLQRLQAMAQLGVDVGKILVNVVCDESFRMRLVGPWNRVVTLKREVCKALGVAPNDFLRQSQRHWFCEYGARGF